MNAKTFGKNSLIKNRVDYKRKSKQKNSGNKGMMKYILLFKTFIAILVLFLGLTHPKLWASNPNQDMPGLDDEKEKWISLTPKTGSAQNIKEEGNRKEILAVPGRIKQKQEDRSEASASLFYIEVLPKEILKHIFCFLPMEDLGRVAQVSTCWRNITIDSSLWTSMGVQKYGDYLSTEDLKENPRQLIIHHYLSVIWNTKKDLSEIKRMELKYKLNLFIPYFKACLLKYQGIFPGYSFTTENKPFLELHQEIGMEQSKGHVYGKFVPNMPSSESKKIESLLQERDELIKLGIDKGRKVSEPNPYFRGWDYYTYHGNGQPAPHYARYPTSEYVIPSETHFKAARKLNEDLILLGDEDAIWRKEKELGGVGRNIYDRNLEELRIFLEELRKKKILIGFCGEVASLNGGGHRFDTKKLKMFIEDMTVNEVAMIKTKGYYLKSFGLKYGVFGYEGNTIEAIEYIKVHNVPY